MTSETLKTLILKASYQTRFLNVFLDTQDCTGKFDSWERSSFSRLALSVAALNPKASLLLWDVHELTDALGWSKTR